MIYLKKQIKTLDEYLEKLKLIEAEIEREKKLQEELKKKKKLLEMLLENLKTKSKNCELRIEDLKYKIKTNENWMSKYNPAYIKKLARATAIGVMTSFIGVAGAAYGFSSLLSLGILASALATSMALSYSVYIYFMSSYKRKASNNIIFNEKIEELTEEKYNVDKELFISDGLIKELEKDIIKSETKTKDLELEAGTVMKDWTDYNEKQIENIPRDFKDIELEPSSTVEEVGKVEARVLKLIPKEVKKEMKNAA